MLDKITTALIALAFATLIEPDVKAVAVSDDGELVAAMISGTPSTLSIWNRSDPTHPIARAGIPPRLRSVVGLAFSADSRTILALDEDNGTLQRWHEIDWRQQLLWWLEKVHLK